MTRYRWVTARKAEGFPITMACDVADVSRQAFHDWRARTAGGPTATELAETELVGLMREIHVESDATYGEPRMTTELAEEHPPLPDLIGRRFAPAAPDVAWCGDITYVATGEGWLYVASVLDLGSRRLVGYSMAEHMRTELVADALEMAAAARGGRTAGVIFHGDRGSRTCRANTAS